MKNRRMHERTPVVINVVLEIPGYDPVKLVSMDISSGGIYLENNSELDTSSFIKAGTKGRVIISQQTPDGFEEMTATIEIVRVTEKGAGAKLLSELVYQNKVI